MSKSINTTGEFYFGVSEEKSTGVYSVAIPPTTEAVGFLATGW